MIDIDIQLAYNVEKYCDTVIYSYDRNPNIAWKTTETAMVMQGNSM